MIEVSHISRNCIILDSGGTGFLPELLVKTADLIRSDPGLTVEHLFLEYDEFGERIILYTLNLNVSSSLGCH